MVAADLASKPHKTVERFVHAPVLAAGKRIRDEEPVEEGIELPVNGVMEEAVTDRGLMDIARFGVGNVEGFIAAVDVAPTCKICVDL